MYIAEPIPAQESQNINDYDLMTRKSYPSDLTDQEWQLVEPLLSSLLGRKRSVDPREILNAILYVSRTKCAWRMLPHDLPVWGTVYYYYRQWGDDGTLSQVHKLVGR